MGELYDLIHSRLPDDSHRGVVIVKGYTFLSAYEGWACICKVRKGKVCRPKIFTMDSEMDSDIDSDNDLSPSPFMNLMATITSRGLARKSYYVGAH